MLDLAIVEKKIGYTFRNKALLETALTHTSYALAFGCADNERLEYLGQLFFLPFASEHRLYDVQEIADGHNLLVASGFGDSGS